MREQWITHVFSFLTPHIIRQRRTNTLGLQPAQVPAAPAEPSQAPTPIVPSSTPSPDTVPGLQQARANIHKAKAEHRAALLDEIREQSTSFREFVAETLAPPPNEKDPPGLHYWNDYFGYIKYDCLEIGGRLRADLAMEITALINRWKRLAESGVEVVPRDFMVNMIASVEEGKKAAPQHVAQAPTQAHSVPLGGMTMVQPTSTLLHHPSTSTTVFRPQQQVVGQPQVIHRPPAASTPYEGNTSLQSLGISASFVLDHLPHNFSNAPSTSNTPSTPVHTPSTTLHTPQN
ncbi:uncharacterized protein LOC126986632 [Eriocheir sinensis]|uniref:uncharacterized protein LOC126986632 n=1 Tax=Eriocheir sinensis TaxID=95602 RepID=UPI0021C72A56|nr:uncharacterized protein LOC126986632 [Eriocheir sinensis]